MERPRTVGFRASHGVGVEDPDAAAVDLEGLGRLVELERRAAEVLEELGDEGLAARTRSRKRTWRTGGRLARVEKKK